MHLSALLAAALAAPPTPDPATAFKFKDGDRIVWLGNTLVEREQRYGYWETALLAANADKNITVRNLGWSGDTVFGDARAGFDNAAKGYERMVSLALELKPTVIFVSFGTNEAFDGEAGLPKFEKGLEKLLDSLKPANARVVLFTPMPFEPLKQFPFFPKPATSNLQSTPRLCGRSVPRGSCTSRICSDLGCGISRVRRRSGRLATSSPR